MPVRTSQPSTPQHIELDLSQRELRITWGDGYHSTYPLAYLRQICPCAICDQQPENQDPADARALVVSTELRPDHPVARVGSYALQFFWADGHNTGIYTFAYLRQQSVQNNG